MNWGAPPELREGFDPFSFILEGSISMDDAPDEFVLPSTFELGLLDVFFGGNFGAPLYVLRDSLGLDVAIQSKSLFIQFLLMANELFG